MKKTKQAEKIKHGGKITFRVNSVEDKKIIDYIAKASNGSAFIKEAINFYIRAIEKDITDSYYLQTDDDRWEQAMNALKNINTNNYHNISNDNQNHEILDAEEIIFDINDIYVDEIVEQYNGGM